MRVLKLVLCAFTFLSVLSANTYAGSIHALTILEVEVKSNSNCLAKVDKWIGVGCNNRISFQCNGPASKDIAYRMFDVAQMAYALNKKILLTIDDVNKVDGFCVATRIRIQEVTS
jgi:hypothetical protein